MNYRITLITQDEQNICFSCKAEQIILNAAELAGFFIPAVCKAGGCGACIARCTQGNYRLYAYNSLLLPENPIEKGDILLCCASPESDLQISAPYNASQIQIREEPN